MKKYRVVYSIVFIIIMTALSAVLFSACLPAETGFDPSGAWYLVSLENYDTGTEYDFDLEALLLNEDGTGIEIYLPCDYYEEYSYITWEKDTSASSIRIKHSSDYIYDLEVVEISDDEFECAFYYEGDPDTYYLATYEKMEEGSFGYVGCWSFWDYIEDGEYYDTDTSYLYLYPDGTFEHVYYEVEDEITENGEWYLSGDSLMLEWEGYEVVNFENSLNVNTLELYSASDDAQITYVYKRYYGQITNVPPATYPQNMWDAINNFFSAIFKNLAKGLS